MAQITYSNKVALNENSSIADINKVKADDMNEIKSVVNNNYSEVGDITTLTTTDKTSVVNAINEIDDKVKDYVIERGTSNINGYTWKWWKWESGLFEMTGYNAFSGISCNQSSAGTYYGGSKTLTLPFSFSEQDFVGTQEQGPRSSGIYVYTANVSGTTLTIEFRAHASGTNLNCAVNFYIRGTIS